MSVKVYVGGGVVSEEDATISVFDRGFLYGDSVYEVIRTSCGRPVDYDRHLERLQRSAAAIWLPLPSKAEIAAAVGKTLSAAGNSESYVRIIATRGAGDIGLDVGLAKDANLLVIVKPLTLPRASLYVDGAKIRIVAVRRTSREAVDPSVKSGNYLNNILALAEARKAGADEAVMLSPDGLVAEGSSSNVFAVTNGRIVTPPGAVGLLVGITRQRVIEIAAQRAIEVAQVALTPEALRGADEVFITSSVRGIMPISMVDDQHKPAPGPITSKLMAAYADFLAGFGEGL